MTEFNWNNPDDIKSDKVIKHLIDLEGSGKMSIELNNLSKEQLTELHASLKKHGKQDTNGIHLGDLVLTDNGILQYNSSHKTNFGRSYDTQEFNIQAAIDNKTTISHDHSHSTLGTNKFELGQAQGQHEQRQLRDQIQSIEDKEQQQARTARDLEKLVADQQQASNRKKIDESITKGSDGRTYLTFHGDAQPDSNVRTPIVKPGASTDASQQRFTQAEQNWMKLSAGLFDSKEFEDYGKKWASQGKTPSQIIAQYLNETGEKHLDPRLRFMVYKGAGKAGDFLNDDPDAATIRKNINDTGTA